ncbi:DUF4412 domain-containing protein [Draconibacterium sp. IB214405]|uniref:DUF4412 domain-containing protein n=1 Tax=Draconibacterium sp. IB214405 TaxID=3097352 RepID=UPI002A184ACE|nr:DUF4412 domain-containing protein [Draconibacterium sp. IB214405]MDX8341137.1 DUF4412 domain-containing protein [Draconibacterium sp. IB214405]
MKSTIKIALLTCFAILFVQVACGQSFLDRVKNKAKNKIEQRIDEKVDKEMDKSLDKIENRLDSITGTENEDPTSSDDLMQNRMSTMMQGLGMSGDPVPVEDNYSFNQLVQMHLEMYDNNEQQTQSGEFITHLNAKTGNLAYEVVSNDFGDTDQGLFIIDSKNQAMIMLNNKDGEKTGMVYGMGTFFENFEEYDTNESDEETLDMSYLHPGVKKTGKTKKIAGYKCEQYTYNTEDVDSEFWITDELKTSDRDFFSTLFKTSALTNGMGYGYVMESTSKNKDSGNTNKMQVTRVDNNTSSNYDLSSYQITNLGTFKMPSAANEE